MNFKLPFRNGNKLKFGAKVVRKTKDKEVDFYEYTPKDEEAFMANSLQNTVDQTNKNFMPDHKYQAGIYADKQYVGSLDLNNPSLFVQCHCRTGLWCSQRFAFVAQIHVELLFLQLEINVTFVRATTGSARKHS